MFKNFLKKASCLSASIFLFGFSFNYLASATKVAIVCYTNEKQKTFHKELSRISSNSEFSKNLQRQFPYLFDNNVENSSFSIIFPESQIKPIIVQQTSNPTNEIMFFVTNNPKFALDYRVFNQIGSFMINFGSENTAVHSDLRIFECEITFNNIQSMLRKKLSDFEGIRFEEKQREIYNEIIDGLSKPKAQLKMVKNNSFHQDNETPSPKEQELISKVKKLETIIRELEDQLNQEKNKSKELEDQLNKEKNNLKVLLQIVEKGKLNFFQQLVV